MRRVKQRVEKLPTETVSVFPSPTCPGPVRNECSRERSRATRGGGGGTETGGREKSVKRTGMTLSPKSAVSCHIFSV